MSIVYVITETYCEYEGDNRIDYADAIIGVTGDTKIAKEYIFKRIDAIKEEFVSEVFAIKEIEVDKCWSIEFRYMDLVESYTWFVEDFRIIES